MDDFFLYLDSIQAVDDLIDDEKTTRFVTRFICVESLSDWVEVCNRIKIKIGRDSVLNISKFCKNEEVFPNINNLKNELDQMIYNSEKILILPISELIRLNSRYINFLLSLAEYEKKYNLKRIFVPLYAFEHEIKEILKNNLLRFKEKELPKIIKLEYDEKIKKRVKLIISNFYPPNNKYFICKGLRNYLAFWEEPSCNNMDFWIVSKEIHFFDSLNPKTISDSFEISKYDNAFEYLKDRFEELNKFGYEVGDEDKWRDLVDRASEENSLEEIFKKILNIYDFSPLEILKKIRHLKEFEKWIAWLWLKLKQDMVKGYLSEVLKDSNHFEDLNEKIENKIFDLIENDRIKEIIPERKELLENLGLFNRNKKFWEKYDDLNDDLTKLLVLTNLDEEEKVQIICCLRSLLEKEGSLTNKINEVLKYISQDYFLYLTKEPNFELFSNDNTVAKEFIKNYFKVYRYQRFEKKLRNEVVEILKNWNESLIWSFEPRHEALQKLLNDYPNYDCLLLWVDGLGLEWSSLIEGLFENDTNIEIMYGVCRSNIPSTTDFNEIYEENINLKIEEMPKTLDELAHSNKISYEKSFAKEVEFVKNNIIERIKRAVNEYDMVILTSDHGLSRVAMLSSKKVEIPEGFTSKYCGRYAQKNNDAYKENKTPFDPEKFIISGDYIISIGLDYFKSQNRTGSETHGGALPEEILIPLFVFKNKSKDLDIKFEVIKHVEIDHEFKGTLIIKVNKEISDLALSVSNLRFEGIKNKEDHWEFKVKGLKEGKYKGELSVKGKLTGTIEFEVRRKKLIQNISLFN